MATIHLTYLYETKSFTDVEFVLKTEDGSEKTLQAHINILAAASSVFQTVFSTGADESGRIRIDDATFEEFDAFLSMVYGCDDHISLANATALLTLIDKYQVSSCYSSIEKILPTAVDGETLRQCIELANRFTLSEEAQAKIGAIVFKKLESFIELDGLRSTNAEIMNSILRMDALKQDEMAIFNLAVQWAKASLTVKAMPLTTENISKELQLVRESIRFPLMSAMNFISITKKYPNLMDVATGMDIISHITIGTPLTTASGFSNKRRLVGCTVSMKRSELNVGNFNHRLDRCRLAFTLECQMPQRIVYLSSLDLKFYMMLSGVSNFRTSLRVVFNETNVMFKASVSSMCFTARYISYTIKLEPRIAIMCNGEENRCTVILQDLVKCPGRVRATLYDTGPYAIGSDIKMELSSRTYEGVFENLHFEY